MKQGIVVMLGLFLGLMVQGAGAADVQMNGNVGVSGSVTASSFVGDGSGLSGVDTRTAISACGMISTSGSYYVTQNLTTTGSCITVTANDVTIDLNGFTLTGDGSGTTDYGVHINNVSNVEVKNGTVRSFYGGIYANFSGAETVSNRVLNVRAVGNGYGIYLISRNNLIKDCSVANSTIRGVHTVGGSIVTHNIVHNNQGNGIFAPGGGTVTHNTAFYNQGIGIYANVGSVTHNTANENNQSNSAYGAGIVVGDNCFVKNNTVRSNLQNNIRVEGTGNAIEENLVTDSTYGISFAAAGNFYANNRLAGNTTTYSTCGGCTQTSGGGNYEF